jgi:hypothetical protein
MTTTFSIESLIAKTNQIFPAVGDWAHLTLLSGDLTTGLAYTADPATNILSTATPHGLITGSRVRLVGGTLPTPLLVNNDYYVLFVSATTLRLSISPVDVQLNNPVDLADAGSGALTLTEQALKSTDLLSVLINKEIVHPSWSNRLLLSDLGVATGVGGVAETPGKSFAIYNTDATPLTYGHHLYIESVVAATGALGNIPPVGTGFALETLPNIVTLSPGEPPRSVFLKLRVRNV